MLLSILIGLVFIAGGLIVGVVIYFGSMFDAPGATTDWISYVAALGAILLGIAIIVFR